jgi:hypothetical protein
MALSGSGPTLPQAFSRLPADVKARATVVVAGAFRIDRGPCEWLPDGSRRWPLLKGFSVGTVYRGKVRTKYIGVEIPRRAGSSGDDLTLVEGREYVLLLRPSKKSLGTLARRDGGMNHQDALTKDEIVAIVEP